MPANHIPPFAKGTPHVTTGNRHTQALPLAAQCEDVPANGRNTGGFVAASLTDYHAASRRAARDFALTRARWRIPRRRVS